MTDRELVWRTFFASVAVFWLTVLCLVLWRLLQ
jgi:hypothetical protein